VAPDEPTPVRAQAGPGGGPVLGADPLHDVWMTVALEEAGRALAHGDVPIGAVVVGPGPDGVREVIASRHNERELRDDPTAHAELLALRDAAARLERWRLDDCLLVVTLEPCPMCAGAAWAARIGGLVFGAEDPKAGATGSLYHLGQDPRLNHEFPVRGRVLVDECAAPLRSFFASRRPAH
jgi:tRNA(adenine34) deaminase